MLSRMLLIAVAAVGNIDRAVVCDCDSEGI